MPSWAWIFVGLCAVIPFLTLGGALPAAIGLGGAAVNYQVASSQRAKATKLVLLSGTTIAAWVLLGLLLLALGR